MRRILLSTILAVFFCGTLLSSGKSIVVDATNPLAKERANETISIRISEIQKLMPNIRADELVVRNAATREQLPSQVVEGEFLFQSHFKPNERKEFLITEQLREKRATQTLTDGRFVLPREDYAWENDRIAFRMYGPALAKEVNNGIDVWTKRVRYPVVAKWYKESAESGRDTYHEDHGEGADFFSVGKTLGAGGSGIWFNGRLCQPGVFSSQRTIATGPLRVVFELTYNWNVDGRTFKEVKRISLDAGENLNRIDVAFTGVSDTLTIACGLVKRKGTTYQQHENLCRISLWGQTTDDSTNGSLGTGVILAPQQCTGFVEDEVQYMILGRVAGGKPFTYYAGAGWTRSGDFATREEWNDYLDQFAERLQHPLRVALKHN